MIGGGVVKNGKAHVFEISNRASVQKLNEQDVAGITARIDNHESGLNTNAHGIQNIVGLQTALDGKQALFTGFTGSLSVITSIDFGANTTTTATINISNGIITSVV